jgi:PAS domain S-box-containing protein
MEPDVDTKHLMHQRQNNFNLSSTLRLVIRESLQPVIIARADGAGVEASPAACKMFGLSQTDLSRIGWRDLFDQSSPEYFSLTGPISHNENANATITAVHSSGKTFPVDIRVMPAGDDTGGRLLCFFVTPKESHLTAILNSSPGIPTVNEEKLHYALVLESISDGYVTLNSDWVYTYVNEKAASMMQGRKKEELVGMNIWDLNPDAVGGRFYTTFHEVMKTRKAAIFDEYYEPWDRYFENRIYPANDGGLAIFFTDITEHRRAEKLAKQSEEDLKLILDVTDGMFMIVDDNLKLVAMNRAYRERLSRALGQKLERGDDLLDAASPEQRVVLEEIFARVLQGEKLRRKFKVGSGPNGEVIEILFSPISDKDGKIRRFMMSASDITMEEAASSALKNSEEKYRSLFYANPMPFWIQDVSTGRILDVNNAAIEKYGYPREEFLTLTADSIMQPPDPCGPGSAVGTGPVRHRKKDGEVIDVLVTSNSISHEGQPAVLVSAQDITNLRNAQVQLLSNERKFRSLIEKGNEIIALTDASGTISYMSPSIKLILGYSAEDRIGTQPFAFIHPEDVQMVKMQMAEVAARADSCAKLRWRHLHADGRWRWMEGVATNLLADPDVRAIVHNFRDITIQKEIEDALRVNNERYKLVAKATQDSIWDWDLVSNRVHREGRRLETSFGHPGWEAEDVDKFWNQFAHPEDWVNVSKRRNEILKDPSQSYWEDEYRFMRADGQYAWVYDCGYILRNGAGEPVRMIGASHDITEQRRYEEELKDKNDELKRLSAYLQRVREDERKYIAREVHDQLGQLATALKIDIDWLNIRLPEVEQLARKRIEHAMHTIEVLIFSVRKIASSLRPSVLDDFGLNAALKWHCTEFQNLNGIACKFDPRLDDTELPVFIKTELFRVAQESLTNVMRHANATEVLVTTEEDERHYFLTIMDNGQGFDIREGKNTLGLVGLRERVSSMNGHLDINSNPGKGTVILVKVPKSL